MAPSVPFVAPLARPEVEEREALPPPSCSGTDGVARQPLLPRDMEGDRHFFRNGAAVQRAPPRQPNAAREVSGSKLTEDEEVNQFLCRMCSNIPEAKPSKGGSIRQLFRTIFSGLGFGLDKPQVASNVHSLHDLVAKLITEDEVNRLIPQFPGLVGQLLDGTRCMPMSILKDRVLLVVNTASQ
mmetsp:Transcript_75857/g.158146  ORF Transcript_75857/g.158146 Transcript_75857/m.158146 type:complete len:183 (+) Transcript_75857:37-585(+)